jgi:glutathione S-transferase
MLLYDSQVSGNCYKVRLLLAQLGLGYERREVDVIDRAKVLQWLFFEQYSHEPHIAVVRFWMTIAKAPPAQEELEARRKAGYSSLEAMERHLSTVADRADHSVRTSVRGMSRPVCVGPSC